MNVSLQNRLFPTRLVLLLAAVATAGVITVAGVRAGLSLPTSAISHPAPSVPAQPLAARVLPASALHGFIVTQRPAAVSSAQTWAARVERSANPVREAARLRRLGFVAGVREQLHGRFPLAAEAVSVAEQYGSVAGARAELAYQRAAAEAGWAAQRVTQLRGIAIPGAFGWIVRSSQVTGINIMFSVGRYFYIVGSGATPGTHGAPTTDQVIHAAQLENLIASGCTVKSGSTASHTPQPVNSMGGPLMLLH